LAAGGLNGTQRLITRGVLGVGEGF
jgi:hypothetical protein